jgi:hypothetical protein
VEDVADDSDQLEAELLADGLANCSAEQLASGRCEQGVIGGPDAEVRAVLVELEHKVVE